ncbi:MAG: YdcF family protein [Eubacteriales bacterium]|nr:YdcF family protein [Eubacteriales bacterium]
MIRIMSMMAGAAGIIWFILPVFTGRILNIGNMTGMAVSLCLLAYGVWRDRIHVVVWNVWQNGGVPRVLLAAAGGLAVIIALTALVLTCMMVRALFLNPAADAAVIVLGCEVKGERPSLSLTSRMDAAVEYLHARPEAVCVVSGGKGEGEQISEAECMYRYMTACGVEPSRIILEDRSSSTRENLLFSSRILQQRGLGDDVAVVTNDYHACRAVLIARKCGLRPGIVAAGTPWWLFPTFYVRELYGLLYQLFL